MKFQLLYISQPGEATAVDNRPMIGPCTRWLLGLCVPTVLALYGLSCMLNAEATMPLQSPIKLYGSSGIAFGMVVAAFAVLIHLHLFWDSVYDSTRASARAKFICMLIMGFATYFLCFKMLPY